MKNLIKQRRKARILLMQTLYRVQFIDHDVPTLIQHAIEGVDLNKIDFPYFEELLTGIIKNLNQVDETLQSYLDRPIGELNPVELSILRVATYELLFRLDLPYKVVINEAIEIAKTYGSVQGYKYVNGVLDKVAPKIRASEKNL